LDNGIESVSLFRHGAYHDPGAQTIDKSTKTLIYQPSRQLWSRGVGAFVAPSKKSKGIPHLTSARCPMTPKQAHPLPREERAS
jgi:hypothetical protein